MRYRVVLLHANAGMSVAANDTREPPHAVQRVFAQPTRKANSVGNGGEGRRSRLHHDRGNGYVTNGTALKTVCNVPCTHRECCTARAALSGNVQRQQTQRVAFHRVPAYRVQRSRNVRRRSRGVMAGER